MKIFRAILSIIGIIFVIISTFFWIKTIGLVSIMDISTISYDLFHVFAAFIKAVFFSLSVLLIYGFDVFLENIVDTIYDILSEYAIVKKYNDESEP